MLCPRSTWTSPASTRTHSSARKCSCSPTAVRSNGLIGAYYLNADARTAFDVRAYTTGAVLGPVFTGLTLGTDSRIGTKTWAVFADLTFDISDQFSLSAGGRYTKTSARATSSARPISAAARPSSAERRHSTWASPIATTSNFHGKRKDTAFTPRASVASSRMLINNIYASWSGASKVVASIRAARLARLRVDRRPRRADPGRFEYMAFEPENGEQLRTRLERLGIRPPGSSWAIAAFHADYKDMQIPASVACTVTGIASFCGVTSNAGKAVFKGVEIESSFRAGENLFADSDRLTSSGSLGYLDASSRNMSSVVAFETRWDADHSRAGARRLADFREVQNTPKWTLSGTLDYDVPDLERPAEL